MVFGGISSEPTHYTARDLAIAGAERLALQHVGKEFVVLEAVASRCAKLPEPVMEKWPSGMSDVCSKRGDDLPCVGILFTGESICRYCGGSMR
jgi:hypothetical protein